MTPGSADFGIVRVIGGKHGGRIGYYHACDEDGNGIVSLGTPLRSAAVRIPLRFLSRATREEKIHFDREWLARLSAVTGRNPALEAEGLTLPLSSTR